MNKNNKRKKILKNRLFSNLLVVAFGIVLYLSLSNFSSIAATLHWLLSILSPFFTGIAIAYLLNIPTKFFENKIFHKLKYKRGLSIVSVYLLSLVFCIILLGLVVPQVVQNLWMLVGNIPSYLENLQDFTSFLTKRFELEPGSLDYLVISYKDIVSTTTKFIKSILPNLPGIAIKISSKFVSVLTATISSIYMLASKEKLLAQSKKVAFALLPQKRTGELIRVGRLSNEVFSGFIGGKIIDSAIIGAICFVFMWVMNTFITPMPFALLISLIVGITNIIPFFGPFIGAIPSLMILLMARPISALWFLIFIIVLQQFDGNFLGPKILGDSTGLPALWVLIAIIVGGKLFGFYGMLLGVPTTAVLYTLSSDFIAKRLHNKGIDQQGNPVPPPEPAHPQQEQPQQEQPPAEKTS